MARVKPLAELILDCIGPAYVAQGFVSGDIIEAWPAIVGERLGQRCQPVKLEWPRGARNAASTRGEPGTLVVRVESAFALELQHLAPMVIERINVHYGWACVGRIVLKQGRLSKARARPRAVELDPASRDAVAAAVEPIEEPGLRDALDRLGIAILGEDSRR